MTTNQELALAFLIKQPAIAAAYGLMAACSLSMGEMEHTILAWVTVFVNEAGDNPDVSQIVTDTTVLIQGQLGVFSSAIIYS